MDPKVLIRNFEEVVAGSCLVFMIVVVICNVFLRYLFSYSLYWAEEVSTICFVWSVFMGAAAVYKNRMDIGIDMLVLKSPAGLQKFMSVFVDVLLLLINGYIFYMAIVFTRDALGKPTAVLGLSSAIYNMALVVAFGLTTFHTIRFMAMDLLKRNS